MSIRHTSSVSHFSDPWNPQPVEIRAWAYEPNAQEPTQDFDLALAWGGHEWAYFDLVSDSACPKRRYFLGVLYLMVGDAVRARYRNVPEPVVRGFVEHGSEYGHPDIEAWQARSRALMADPSTFDYTLWCGGGYARGDT
jgi:hypothetical protein